MNVFELNVNSTSELASKYHSIKVSFKVWLKDGLSDTMLCNNFNVENDSVTVVYGDIKKQLKLSILLSLIEDGDIVVVGGKFN